MPTDAPLVLVLPGDGIGPEIMAVTVRIAHWFRDHANVAMTIEERPIGGAAFKAFGASLPEATLERAREAQAVLLGCVGLPDLDYHPDRSMRPGYSLWYMRRALDLPINLRPIVMRDILISSSTLRPEVVEGTDFVFVRELNQGLYYGEPRGIDPSNSPEARAYNTMFHTREGVRRVAEAAFELARRRRGEVCSVDKSNVLEVGVLWREEVTRMHDERYPDVRLRHMYVDNAAMQIVRDPRQFDVVLTENLFGDILSDAAAMTTGSIGTLPSAALSRIGAPGEPVKGLYEPIHGTAPDIAGQGKANPIGCIMSFAMLMEYSLGHPGQARLLEQAVSRALESGARTPDLAISGQQPASTKQMGDAIISALDALRTGK